MGKQIQRLVNFGVALEGTTNRGTAKTTASVWIPKIDFDFAPTVDVAVDDSGLGVIDARQGSDVVLKYGEGSIGGIVYDNSFGYLLKMALGSSSVTTAAAGVYTHTFTVEQSNAHPSATIFVKDENLDERYALGMLNQLTVNAAVDDYAKFTAGFMSKDGTSVTASSTVAYTEEHAFVPSGISMIIGTGTTATSIRSLRLTINKNVENWPELGSDEPVDIVNKEFSADGEFERVYDGATERDLVLNGTKEAVTIELTGADTIGTASNPKLTFNFAEASFEEFGKSGGAGDVETQTIGFQGNLKISTTSETINVELTNTQSAY
jgi:hypothetical protein